MGGQSPILFRPQLIGIKNCVALAIAMPGTILLEDCTSSPGSSRELLWMSIPDGADTNTQKLVRESRAQICPFLRFGTKSGAPMGYKASTAVRFQSCLRFGQVWSPAGLVGTVEAKFMPWPSANTARGSWPRVDAKIRSARSGCRERVPN